MNSLDNDSTKLTLIYTKKRLKPVFFLYQCRNSRYQAKNNTWCISSRKGNISFFLEKTVVNPETTVDGCNQGLDKVPFLTSQVVHNLREVRDVHHNRHEGRYPTQNFHLFFRHFQNLFHFYESYFIIFFQNNQVFKTFVIKI